MIEKVIDNADKRQLNNEPNEWEKMAQEVMMREPNQEVIEKKFYESNVEFSGEDFIAFRNELFNATPDEARHIVDSRIALLEEKAEKIEKISPARQRRHIHRGYIGSGTAVEFDSGAIGSQFKLQSTDYLFDAVEFLRNNKERIKNGRQFFEGVTGFVNSYFGLPDTSRDRWETIERKTNFNSIQDDDEYWNAIYNIDISVFKGEHVAMCTERSAMAQNIMSVFGYETYYVNGDVSVDGAKEGHAYNIVADAHGQKNLVDYSVTSSLEHNGVSWVLPTMASIENFEKFSAGDKFNTNTWRHIIQSDGKVVHKREHELVYTMMK